MLNPLPIHMLWVSGELSRLARLSLASFRSHGHRVVLWSYDPTHLTGIDAELRDARHLLTGHDLSDLVYLTSLFRYRLLAQEGGTWSDMDIVALAGPEAIPQVAFVASERRRPFRHSEPTATGESLTQVTNCFIGNPRPQADDLWHKAAYRVALLSPEDRTWENVGPHMLSALLIETPDHGLKILSSETVDPVAWWNIPGYLLEDRPPPTAPFMHLYATIWARRGVDANQPFPPNSLIGRLWRDLGL